MESVNETFLVPSESNEEQGPTFPLNIPYFVSELIVALFATLGNALTLYVFIIDRRLRRITNYYIASLALADLLVGVLAIPFAIVVSVGLPRSLWPCLFMISSLIVLCAISIFCLVAVSIDRYWAILHPIAYSRNMTKKVAKRIIWFCWFAGTIVGLLPAFGWYKETKDICFFVRVIDYNYLVFFYFSFIIVPGIMMTFFYSRIFSVVLERERRYVRSRHGILHHVESEKSKALKESKIEIEQDLPLPFTTRLRSFFINVGLLLPSINSKADLISDEKCTKNEEKSQEEGQKNCHKDQSSKEPNSQNATKVSRKEIKAAQNLSIIILFFFVCWFPINTINCIQAFCPDCYVPLELLYFTIMLSHANSAVNPLLYAYNMKDFRRSLKVNVFKCRDLNRGKTIAVTSSTTPSSAIQEVTLSPTKSPKVDPMSLEPSLEVSYSFASELSKNEEKCNFTPYVENSEIKKETIKPTTSYYQNILFSKGVFSSDLRLSSSASQPSLMDLDSVKAKMNRDYHSLEGKGDILTSLLNENQTKTEENEKSNNLNFKYNARNLNAIRPRDHLRLNCKLSVLKTI